MAHPAMVEDYQRYIQRVTEMTEVWLWDAVYAYDAKYRIIRAEMCVPWNSDFPVSSVCCGNCCLPCML